MTTRSLVTNSSPTCNKCECNLSDDSVDYLDNLTCKHKLTKYAKMTSKNTKTHCNENDSKNTNSENCGFYPIIFVSPACETDKEDKLTYSFSLPITTAVTSQYNFYQSYREYLTSPIKNPPLRSLSHPNPIITNPTYSEINSSTGTKRHRHSIAGQTTYFKMLGFNTGGPLPLKKLGGGSTNSLFSTAVISGSSSAPNLRDMIPSTASASAIEGFGGVPPIRPLETLHNALSLRQLDIFLGQMTSMPLFKTPSSTPPKYPTPSTTPINLSDTDVNNKGFSTHPPPLKLQSPCNSLGWSGPPSFVSTSSGPSSPGISDPYSNSKESSEMSSSIVSSDGGLVDNLSHIFLPDLDQDLENVEILMQPTRQVSDSREFSDYFANLQRSQKNNKYGDEVSLMRTKCMEVPNDITITQHSEMFPSASIQIISNKVDDNNLDTNEVDDEGSVTPTTNSPYLKNYSEKGGTRGSVIVKEFYMEPQKISRVSKSFHGKSPTCDSLLNIAAIPRRASEEISTGEKCDITKKASLENSPKKHKSKRHQFKTQLSHPGNSTLSSSNVDARKSSLSNENVQMKTRFTTTLVQESKYNIPKNSDENKDS